MKILVTNDDGIYSNGLRELVYHLKNVSDVVVVAPDREQSAVGTSITVHRPVRITEITSVVAKIKTYIVDGTPSDSVIFALETIVKEKIDLIVSGINDGLNVGSDVFLSGTVAAARYGYYRNIPSIALSVERSDGITTYEVAAHLGELLVSELAMHPGQKYFLNVNLPNVPLKKITGIEITKLGGQTYFEQIKKDPDGNRTYYWIIRPKSDCPVEEGSDISAIGKNHISITPLNSNYTTAEVPHFLKNLSNNIYTKLKN